MKLLLLCLSALNLLAYSYVGKIEPYSSISLKSEAMGKVIYVNENAKFSYIHKKLPILKLDTVDDETRILSLEQRMEASEEIYQISKLSFEKKTSIKSISKFEKNNDKLNMLAKKQSYISLFENLKLQKRNKEKKSFIVYDKYISNIYPKVGELVSIGSKIADIYDISKKKIILFVNKEQIDKLKNKAIYIDGVLSKWYINNISNVVDSKYISSYQVDLLENNKDIKFRFGSIVKVEFK